MYVRNFELDKSYESRRERGVEERTFLRVAWPKNVGIKRTDIDDDKSGADYWVDHGRQRIGVDTKRRRAGAADSWEDITMPELALEVGADIAKGKPGWAMTRHPNTDWFLFLFDDVPHLASLIEADALIATMHSHPGWLTMYPIATQRSKYQGREWRSRCVYVPVDVVRAVLPEGNYFDVWSGPQLY
jgi:hypothetical protein